MKTDWNTFYLKDVVSFVVDNRGKTPTVQKNGHSLLEVNAVSATNKYPQYGDVRKWVSEDIYNTWFRSGHPEIGDILIPTVGTLGAVSYVDRSGCCIAQNLIAVRANSSIIDANFLYYTLKNPMNRLQLLNLNIGGVQPSIKVPHLMNLKLHIPPLAVQKQVSKILSALDDKIELNNAINRNLEEQAQAIFKSWFVDFEPFGGKRVFNYVPLNDLCEIVTKGTTPTTLGKSFAAKGINFLKAETILDNHTMDYSKIAYIDEDTNNLLKRSVIKKSDILFTIAGTLGRFTLVDNDILPANTNQAVGIIRADNSKVSPYYLYSFFIGNWHNDYYAKHIQQAVQANLSLGTIKSLPIAILKNSDMEEYTNLVTPIFVAIQNKHRENKKLAELRDALLPKLMSGEIDVSEVEL